jgi:hypothetical protein
MISRARLVVTNKRNWKFIISIYKGTLFNAGNERF